MNILCPKCGSSRTVPGRCLGRLDAGAGFKFRPTQLRLLSFLGTDVPMSSEFTACVDCGLLWSTIRAEKLQQVVAKKGNTELQERLAHPGPPSAV
jgi:hypothetical protein